MEVFRLTPLFLILCSGTAFGLVGGASPGPSDAAAKSTVAIRDGRSEDPNFCTGVLVDSDLVLTAAHCVKYPEPNRQVVFSFDATAASAPASAVIGLEVPPEFDPTEPHGTDHKNHHDIAVLRFCGGLPPGYSTARPYLNPHSLPEGTPLTLTGYGIADDQPQGPKWNWGHLKIAQSRSGDPGYASTESQVLTSPSVHARNGDSGGPVYYIDGMNSFVLGVDNWGPGDRSFEIYADVVSHWNWIQRAADALRKIKCNSLESF